MSSKKVNKLIEQCLFSLKENGMTASALNYYSTAGFGALRKRHAELEESDFSYEICCDLIRELRNDCECGKMPKHQWRVIRRCAEVLKAYHETGITRLPKLGKWEWIHAPYREKPTPEQFADSDNIFAIVWNVKRELESAGMAIGSLKANTYNGFDKILKHFIAVGITKYDETVINDFVIDAHTNIADRKKFQFVRKSAVLIQEYYQTGKIEHKHLGLWDAKKPNKYFESTIEQFRNDNTRKNRWSTCSDSSAYQAICQFLMTLETMGYYNFQNVTLKVVSDCISVMAKRYTSGLKPTLSYIRSFLRFLAEQNISSIALVKAIPGSVSPKRAVYSGFSTEEIEKILAAVDCSTVQGKRDYAILLIGARTGLRAIDVVNLRRQDIDWRGWAINIIQSKTKQPLGIPLSAEVGNAIADYILKGRPCCNSPNIFIRTNYPLRPLTASAAGSIVKKYFRKAELPVLPNRPIGFHTLRRSFGAYLLESGVPADMIQEMLGQCDLNSIVPYLAASEKGLKHCAIGLIPLASSEGGQKS